MSINFMTISRFCNEAGYSEEAVRSKIKRGQWQQGREYVKAPDNRILISIKGYEEWVSSKAFAKHQTVPSKLTSITKVPAAAKGYPSSPLPLT